MSSTYAQIKLPAARGAQLKALAKGRNLTIVDLIGTWIGEAIEAGEIPDEIPGFVVERAKQPSRNMIRFAVDGGEVVAWPQEAIGLADTLEELASTPGSVLIFLKERVGMVQIDRVGNGVCIELKDQEGARKVVAPGIARDVARQLRRVAKAS